ncbi:MAG: hypothetical protein Kow0077_03090 [Anaerolineae bacterium]
MRWVVVISALLVFGIGAVVSISFYRETLQPDGVVVQGILSHSLDDGYNPVDPTGTFAPAEPFRLSVRVEGAAPNSIVTVRWRYGAEVINSQDQVIGVEVAPYVLGFELARSDDVWPEGDYSVELLLNHERVGELAFRVESPG